MNMLSLKKYLDPVVLPIKNKLTHTQKLRLFGLAKIPLLFLVRPSVLKLSADSCEVKIPLSRMTKNHLGSMYFGTLAIGADCVVAMLALYKAEVMASDKKLVPIFKDFKANFLKRAESDVVFHCHEGQKIEAMILKAMSTGERVTDSILVEAKTPKAGNEIVAQFALGLSLKIL